MSHTFKQIIAAIIILIAICMIYFGSYLPLRKSQLIINAMRNLGSVGTVADLEKILSEPLDFYSPVGHDENVRQVGNVILGILIKQKTLPQAAANELINYAVGYFNPIIDSGKGGNFSQNFLILGQIYQNAGMNYNDNTYLNEAIKYYNQGLIYSPKRPQFMYSLFNIYVIQKDFKSARKIGDEIINYWPNDERIKETISKISGE